MAIGAQIRRHRIAQGLTLPELSAASGVEVGTISALELRDSARSKYFSPLAKALGFSIEELENEGSKTEARVIAAVPIVPVPITPFAQDPAMDDLASLPTEEQVIFRSQLKAAAERNRAAQAKEAADQAEKAEMKAMMQALLNGQRAPEYYPIPNPSELKANKAA